MTPPARLRKSCASRVCLEWRTGANLCALSCVCSARGYMSEAPRSERRRHVLLPLVAVAIGLVSMRTAAQDERLFAPPALLAALDDFARGLDERWSYRHANRADFAGAITALRKKASGGMPIDAFGLELHKIVALGIDGHSSITGYRLPGQRFLPFLIEPNGDRFVAFTPDRSAFLADGFPYVTKVDGRPISEWCAAATVIVPKGSPQYVRHRCLGRMR